MFGNSAILGQSQEDNQLPIVGLLTISNITQNSLDITCAAVDNIGIGKFKIFVNGQLNMVANVAGLINYTIGGLNADTNYDIHVTAVDYTGNESEDSNTVNFTTLTNITNSYLYITTTSTSATWSPVIINSGETLYWKVTGGVTISEQQINVPTLDLSSNVGTASIAIRSTTGFSGLTELRADSNNVVSVDIAAGEDLEVVSFKDHTGLSNINISTLSVLSELTIRDTGISTLNISNNPLLTKIWAYRTLLNTLDISNNPLLDYISLWNSNMTTASLESIITNLNNSGVTGGSLLITGNDGITSNVYTAYQSLTNTKGWYIDVASPAAPVSSFLTPIMTNFRVESATPTRIYFDAPLGPVTGLTTQGFIVTGNTVTAIDTVNKYITVGTAFTFWDNNTIQLEGGNGTIYDFTLQKIENNINEPSSSGTTYYVATDGDNGAAGTSEGTAWATLAYGATQLTAGDVLYVKKGDYGNDILNLTTSGTPTNPIKIIGYGATPNDDPTLTRVNGLTFDANVMPLTSGKIQFNDEQNIVLKNIQVEPNDNDTDCFDIMTAKNVYMWNVYAKDGKNGFFGFRTEHSENIRITRSYVASMATHSYALPTHHLLLEDFYADNITTESNDYYVKLNGTVQKNESIIRDGYIFRGSADTHTGKGHGISIKADEYGNDYIIEHALIENITIEGVGGAAIEARHSEVQYCVYRNITTVWDGVEDSSFYGIRITSAQNNTFENLDIRARYAVAFLGSTENPEALDAGNNNVFKNCIFRSADGIGTTIGIYQQEDTDGQDRVANDNTFVNCTFDDVNNLFYNADGTFAGSGFEITNCIILDTPTLQSTGATIGVTFLNSLFYNGFAAQGTGAITVNPDLNANYQPQAAFNLIQVDKYLDINYDKNDYERADITTVGSVLHADEVVEAPVGTATISNFRVEDATPTLVHFDSTGDISTLTTQGFLIEDNSVVSIDVDNKYFTIGTPLTFWDNYLIRLESGDGTVYDFTLQQITNNINEPASTSQRYVAVGASGGGLTTGDPMSITAAITEATAGRIYWIKAGNYGAITADVGGTGGGPTTPVKFVGYKTNTNDAVTYTKSTGMAFSSTNLPLFDGGGSTADFIDVQNHEYIIIKNLQTVGYTEKSYDGNNSSYIYFENCYMEDGTHGIDFNNTSGHNIHIKDCYVANTTALGIKTTGGNSIIKNSWACSNKVVNMDYYITLGNRDVSASNISAINNTVDRYYDDSHQGHGIAFKTDETNLNTAITYSLIEDNTIINTNLELRHGGVQYNVVRNVNFSHTDPSYPEGSLSIRDGASNNIIEDCYFKDTYAGIYFRDNPGEQGTTAGGHDNTIINTIFDGCRYTIIEGPIDGTTIDQSTGNRFIQCTFKEGTVAFAYSNYSGWDSTTEFINCLWENTDQTITGTFTPTIKNSNLYNVGSWGNAYIGANGNISTPNPALDISYQPQATFIDIDAPIVTGAYYDKNGEERANATTMGAVIHADESIG